MRLRPERPIDQPPHALPRAAVVAHFGTDPVRGLTRSEAARRLTIAGPNELPAAARAPAWRMLLAQGKNVLILILLVAIGLSTSPWPHHGGRGDRGDRALLGHARIHPGASRPERALEALRRMSAPHTTVIRDGEADKFHPRPRAGGISSCWKRAISYLPMRACLRRSTCASMKPR